MMGQRRSPFFFFETKEESSDCDRRDYRERNPAEAEKHGVAAAQSPAQARIYWPAMHREAQMGNPTFWIASLGHFFTILL